MSIVSVLLNYLGINSIYDTRELQKLDFIPLSDDKQQTINVLHQKLINCGVDVTKKLIIISPYASRKTKMLTVEQYAKIVDLLSYKLNTEFEIVLVGSQQASYYINKIVSLCKRDVKNLCGCTSLKDLFYLFSISSLVISPDSGPAYIAESAGTKTVIYFTSTVPEKYGPFPEHVRIIYTPTICSPCYLDECKFKTYKCITQVEPDAIVRNVENMLV
ncbi:MAG: glycosyltransferase family 9 protein [Endomicrobia bacterium]|nr:glycosyltransferase family 9 protein [Endomicrobiia bacterium]